MSQSICNFRLPLALLFCYSLLPAQDRLAYPLPDPARVNAQENLVYRQAGTQELKFDLYRPANLVPGRKLPVVIFLNGIGSPDLRRWSQYTEWPRAVTGAGLAAVSMDSEAGHIPESFDGLLRHLQSHAGEWNLDLDQVAVWVCSANVSAGLPLVMDSRQRSIRAAVIYYGIGEVKEFRRDLPVLLVRAGLDGANLNRQIDALASRALQSNAPMTVMNLPGAHHGFDMRDQNENSRLAIRQTLDFLVQQLRPEAEAAVISSIGPATAVAASYRGDWKAAISAFEALLAKDPKDSELHRNLAMVLLEDNQERRALTEFERALELGNPNRGWISYAAARASMKLGEHEAALVWIDRLKEIEVMRRQLNGDPVFAPLRENPKFIAIAGTR